MSATVSGAGNVRAVSRTDFRGLGTQALARCLAHPLRPQCPVAGGQDEGAADRGRQGLGPVLVDGRAGVEQPQDAQCPVLGLRIAVVEQEPQRLLRVADASSAPASRSQPAGDCVVPCTKTNSNARPLSLSCGPQHFNADQAEGRVLHSLPGMTVALARLCGGQDRRLAAACFGLRLLGSRCRPAIAFRMIISTKSASIGSRENQRR